MNGEALYELAAEEIASGNIRRGVWAKAYAAALGDEAKTKAIYINLRVPQILDELAMDAATRATQEEAERRAAEERRQAEERAKADLKAESLRKSQDADRQRAIDAAAREAQTRELAAQRAHEYYVHVAGARVGPLSISELRACLESGRFTSNTFYWQYGFREYKQLGSLFNAR